MNPSQSRLGALSMLVVAAACVVSVAGCAASRKEAFLLEKSRDHVYRKPVAEVWPQALALLTEKGYSVRQGKEGFEATTEWLMHGAPSSLGTTQVRYMVRGIEKGPGQCVIEFHKHMASETRGASSQGRPPELTDAPSRGNATNFNRDPELEWELLQRVDAESATSLRAEADKIQ
ncbi:hypothetical protein MYSTI_00664 [Myxococcus stipitatus DSM 14675]|uniref:Lipoprotein n=1 Tax=Myxococcus stipitatus (strain DSM 14675 / JCM 12634 / Mx s8) TaxID=1278073 RepID=L7U6D2_MYXSD|nr:hypothetical protein [Myxococcus stipitatus]AGC42014.1 hypothetical protein MYSTI_00664 [Myxococcus stipitatus DSM 14675]